MIDTIRLKSPAISQETARAAAQLLTRRSAVKIDTGELLYEFTSESLRGSYDARVMVQVKNETWFASKETQKLIKVPCEPFLEVEASVHKLMLGHNVSGGPVSFQAAARWFVSFISHQMGNVLPPADEWTALRIDVAECYQLGSYEAVEEYITSLNAATYPRREVNRYANESIYCPGTTTTVKAYHKGPEFSKHDSRRLRPYLEPNALEGLQLEANGILRVETEIKSKAIQAAIEQEPLVKHISEEWLMKTHDREVVRLLKEGQSEMETVRTTKQVRRRLYEWYTAAQAGPLYATWLALASVGEQEARKDMPRRTWYDHKKKLLDAGCTWSGTNVITFQTLIPEGFAPVRMDPRRLVEEAFSVTQQLAEYQEVA